MTETHPTAISASESAKDASAANATLSELHRCKNCDSELLGDFCHVCGQQDRQYIRSIFAVVGDLFGEISHWDSRFYRTLVSLFARPAFLTQEFVRGRHASYVPPLRLYFFISLISFFVLTSLIDFSATPIDVNGAEETQPAAVESVLQQTQQEIERGLQAAQEKVPPEASTVPEDLKVNIPFVSDAQNLAIKERLDVLAEDPNILIKRLVSLAPQMMLLMLPFWALFLKITYMFSKRYYLEHLTAALHTHAFLLLCLTVLTLVSKGSAWATTASGSPLFEDIVNWVENILLFWMVSYMLFTQKLFYGQSWPMTLFKFLWCGVAYTVLLSIAFIVMILIGLLTA
ncbi:DUF3667 domain-containing protein [Pseudidiomarina sediminum]|uniref:DUF3667 domain-containing protein n=1 Tax=Pseudidiomarina sediminum TaxID=431675 RepID=A0A432Z2F4_9GAMM|nr:DUF3667 domain-containing protein [Pseudidiomarina sediminum]RUO72074.1 DUF3667 domain-containing protein [Pseudidiomarina sediminum]